MNRFSLLLLAATGVPLMVHAQPAHKLAAVTDANATVPALQYHSAFSGQPVQPASTTTPDKVWIKANQDVAGAPGHGGHGGHGAHGGTHAAPAPDPQKDPHKDHQQHQGHDMHTKGH